MNAEESRKIMNDFNFGGLYEYNEEKGRYYEFEKYQNDKVYAKLEMAKNISNLKPILTVKEELDKTLKDTELRCGIISNGNHGLDLLEVYNLNHKKDESEFKKFLKKFDEEPRVMFVFDSPANNLKDCFGYDENLENLFKKEPKEFLCKHLWRSKDLDQDECTNPEVLTGSKSYGQMIVSFMYNYKMKNVYTTNLFRYEITTRNKEAFVSLGSMNKKDLVDPVFEKIFLEEAKAFKPDIIVAVGKMVYKYLTSKKREQQLKEELGDIKLVSVYHPRARVRQEKKQELFDNLGDVINHVRDSK